MILLQGVKLKPDRGKCVEFYVWSVSPGWGQYISRTNFFKPLDSFDVILAVLINPGIQFLNILPSATARTLTDVVFIALFEINGLFLPLRINISKPLRRESTNVFLS